jgi:hypothetical protein
MVAALIVVGAVVLLGAAGYFLRGTRRAAEPVVRYARCPECGQKVRYADGRGGRHVQCPRCRSRWTLPATPQPLPEPTMSAGRYGRPLVLRRSA